MSPMVSRTRGVSSRKQDADVSVVLFPHERPKVAPSESMVSAISSADFVDVPLGMSLASRVLMPAFSSVSETSPARVVIETDTVGKRLSRIVSRVRPLGSS